MVHTRIINDADVILKFNGMVKYCMTKMIPVIRS